MFDTLVLLVKLVFVLQVKKRRKSGVRLKCTMLNQWARSKNEVNENEEVGKIFTAENR